MQSALHHCVLLNRTLLLLRTSSPRHCKKEIGEYIIYLYDEDPTLQKLSSLLPKKLVIELITLLESCRNPLFKSNKRPAYGVLDNFSSNDNISSININNNNDESENSQYENMVVIKENNNPLFLANTLLPTSTSSLHKLLEEQEQAQSAHSAVEIIIKPKGSLLRSIEDTARSRESRTIGGVVVGSGVGREHRNTYKPTNITHIDVSKNKQQIEQTEQIEQTLKTLPIHPYKEELLKSIKENQILILIGETGSGKSTQLPQFLLEQYETIACTQPRRVAALSVAKRVSEEQGTRLGGDLVGYSIRFDDCTTEKTRLRYLTDGWLLRELIQSPMLNKYSVVVLDEAHERSISTDVLFVLLKRVCAARKDFRLVVTSATLEAEKFSSYFGSAKIMRIPGRTFPVELFFRRTPITDYISASVDCCLKINEREAEGDILLFLTGQEEIEEVSSILEGKETIPPIVVCPLYGQMTSESQNEVFKPAPRFHRKIVIATNIAETSLTIPNIHYVVDPGFSKQSSFNPRLGMDSLMVTVISRAQGRQRAGRAGRTGPGKVYRLYTEGAWDSEMDEVLKPEIQRTNLMSLILLLKAIGIRGDLRDFDWMDPPSPLSVLHAQKNLWLLSLLDTRGSLTPLGRQVSLLPLEVTLSRFLLELGGSEDGLIIVAMLSLQGALWIRTKDNAEELSRVQSRFSRPDSGDHATLLSIYRKFKESSFSKSWCTRNCLHYRNLMKATKIIAQLRNVRGIDWLTCRNSRTFTTTTATTTTTKNTIAKALCSAFFLNVARRDRSADDCSYKTLTSPTTVYIHPSSVLYRKNPEWVIYNDLLLTTKEYMRDVSIIDPKWLIEVSPNMFGYADPSSSSTASTAATTGATNGRSKISPLWKRGEENGEWRISNARRL